MIADLCRGTFIVCSVDALTDLHTLRLSNGCISAVEKRLSSSSSYANAVMRSITLNVREPYERVADKQASIPVSKRKTVVFCMPFSSFDAHF